MGEDTSNCIDMSSHPDTSDCIDMSSHPDTGLQADHECKLQALQFRR